MPSKTENKRKLRPAHLIIFIVFIIVRKSFADEHDQTSHDNSGHSNFEQHTHNSGGAKKGEEHHEEGHEHAQFSVFHVNFEHVEVPFIISLWIFVSSLAKVGKKGLFFQCIDDKIFVFK